MPIIVPCRGCQKNLKAKEKLYGKRVKCPACGQVILVPDGPPLAAVASVEISSESFEEVVARGDAAEVAGFLHSQQFTLIQVEDDSGSGAVVPWMVEVDDFPALIAFASIEHAQRFAAAVPDSLGDDGSLPGFVVEGAYLVEPLSEGCGVLLNPQSDDCVVLAPWLVDKLRTVKPKPGTGPIRVWTASGRGDGSPEAKAVREQVMAFLEGRGFRPVESLPLPDMTREVRPVVEVAGRLMALGALFMWVSAPEDAIPSKAVRKHMKNKLGKWLTKDEAKIASLSRGKASEEQGGSIGWRLENMWSLAWVLGFEAEPTIEASQIDHGIGHQILFEMLGGLEGTVEDLVEKSKVRSAEEVNALEDRFYCAHNAVRSAQMGEETVPDGFHPVMHGGVVHERRHSLTWCLSPGTAWDDTDLST